MRRRAAAWGLVLLGLLAASGAAGHEVRPAYLELRQAESAAWEVLFKVPARGERRLALYARLPEGCRGSAPVARPAPGAHVERWRVTCEPGLVGKTIRVEGLPATRTDVLARVEGAEGWTQTARLTPEAPSFTVAGRTPWTSVARTYFGLGVEHILLGVDHLLFVTVLLLVVGSVRRLVATVTTFTVAHSLTLAVASLGLVHVPQAPVEAAIALSIVFVAAEVLHGAAGRPGLTARRPWLVAFAFGLLHGLGFAGALREVGLPQDAIPAALAFFNLGVEAGQLVFVGAVFGALALGAQAWARLRRDGPADPWAVVAATARPAAYGIGTLAAYWLIERTAAFWS